jgi:hypothetical protein
MQFITSRFFCEVVLENEEKFLEGAEVKSGLRK